MEVKLPGPRYLLNLCHGERVGWLTHALPDPLPKRLVKSLAMPVARARKVMKQQIHCRFLPFRIYLGQTVYVSSLRSRLRGTVMGVI